MSVFDTGRNGRLRFLANLSEVKVVWTYSGRDEGDLAYRTCHRKKSRRDRSVHFASNGTFRILERKGQPGPEFKTILRGDQEPLKSSG